MSINLDQLPKGETEKIKQVDPWAWTYLSHLMLNSGPYQIEGHEFQIDVFQCDAQRQCAKKSPQMAGFTEMLVIEILHGMRYKKFPQGAIYYFPTSDEVSRFSKSRFKPFLKKNYDAIGKYVQDTDSVDIKQIGDAFLFFNGMRLLSKIEGAQKSSSKLKALPSDFNVYDELDEMDPSAVELSLGRMDHSTIQREFYLANATVPNFGIDKKYQQSDQRVWAIKCQHCGKHTCLELEFPTCLKKSPGVSSSKTGIINTKDAGEVYRACKKCGSEIYPKDGIWIAQYPSKTKDMVGWWISHLNSHFTEPGVILREYEDPTTDIVRFYNRRLGMAKIAAENQLTVNQVYSCCGPEAIQERDGGPCAMGVDVGKDLHVTIGRAPYIGAVKVLKPIAVSSFEDVHDLGVKFNVRSAVFDLYPETRKVRGFRSSVSYPVYGCAYSEHQKGAYAWDEKSGVVTVNRTELCDHTHELVTTPGKLEIPRRSDDIEKYAKQICNIAKRLEEDKESGTKIYRYIKLGPDHYRHSLNYLHLALLKMQGQIAPLPPAGQQKAEYYYG